MKFLLQASSTSEATQAHHFLIELDQQTVERLSEERKKATSFLKSLNQPYGFVAVPAHICFEAGTLDKGEDWKGWADLEAQGWAALDDNDDFADRDAVRIECHMVRYYDDDDMYLTAIGKWSDERLEAALPVEDMARHMAVAIQ